MTASARLAMIFSCVGHFYIHMMTAFYFVIVLTLSSNGTSLIASGCFDNGVGVAGIVGHSSRVPGGPLSVRGTMVIFFIGMGLSSVVCGLVSTNLALLLALGIGIFGAIYHPVGIPWPSAAHPEYRQNSRRERYFGVSVNVAAVIAGVLIDSTVGG